MMTSDRSVILDHAGIRSAMHDVRKDRPMPHLTCGIRSGLGSGSCWCAKAGMGGMSLPCPPLIAEPEAEAAEPAREFHFPIMSTPWSGKR
ncbi:MAG: hypothetical protein ACRD9W_15975 [Terriglobia bacterium]